MKIRILVGAVVVLGTVAGVALGAGGLGLFLQLTQTPPAQAPIGPGQRLASMSSFLRSRPDGTPTEVAALGRLTPRGEVIDIGGLMGDRLGELKIEEGQTVEKDALLGYLESHGERKAERDAIAAQLKEARARLAAELAQADAQIKEAELAVRQARELGPLDVQAQEATVRLLEGEVASAQSDLDLLQSQLKKGNVTRQPVDQQAQLLRRRQEELSAAKAGLAKASQGLPLSQEKAEAQLEAARAGRQRVEASVPIESLTRNLALAEVRLERTALRAPRAGTVLKIMTRPGERVEYKPILKLADTSVMYAVAEVYENDAHLVQPGQRAKVGSQALPQPLSGTVEKVGHMIHKNDVLHVDPAADADARVVEVWIRLDPADAAARMTNLQVDVLITLQE